MVSHVLEGPAMRTTTTLLLIAALAVATAASAAQSASKGAAAARGIYFPPPGQTMDKQDQRKPAEVGLTSGVIARLQAELRSRRWALWRHGYLVHVEGDFNKQTEVKSLRKTWHALTVGAAIQQGRIPSIHQKIGVWCKELTGRHAEATWWHVMTQTSGFDYPCGQHRAYAPGEMWTYSDKNPRHLCNALARVYGKRDYRDHYHEVVGRAYFDAIGMRGWKCSPSHDGVRFHFDLEDMGRLGLLVLARGEWNGVEVIPQWFVEALERKQTRGAAVNYDGPDDGKVNLDPKRFPEAPYGFMTWVNTAGDYYPGADKAWAWGAGAGGTCVLWNHRNGIVFAGVGIDTDPTAKGIPHIIEACVAGPNPLVKGEKDLGHVGRFPKWGRIEISLAGPDSQGRGTPNPFSIEVDALLTSPSGKKWRVPGFYDGDGKGRLDGDVWKVRFSPDETGQWSFESKSPDRQLDGVTGSFVVTPVPPDAEGLWKWGRLESVSTPENKIRYLKFRDGPYWLKAGCDDPENFLGKFRHYDTPVKRRAAIDYLAGKGVNSMYIMTHNVGGDHRDVWPWLGETEAEAKANAGKDARFDVAKLEEWRQLFEHMHTRGVVPYLVLRDDASWPRKNNPAERGRLDHARYYREMIARFGYLPALLLNISEEAEENYTLAEALACAKLLKKIDPYDHPVGIHNVNSPKARSQPYIEADHIDFSAIQTGGSDPLIHNHIATLWISECLRLKERVVMVGFDEPRPLKDRRGWWSAYMAGAVWEVHTDRPYDRPMSAHAQTWEQLGGARAFMESLPFWEMEPNNALVRSGKAFCLAKPGTAYGLYLPAGGTVTVNLAPGPAYDYAWWNPANGKDGGFQGAGRTQGGEQHFTAPGPGDWALRIVGR